MFEELNNFDGFLTIFSKDGNLVYANIRALKVFDTYLSAAVNYMLSDFVSPKDCEALKLMSGKNVLPVRFNIPDGDGIECNGKVINGTDGMEYLVVYNTKRSESSEQNYLKMVSSNKIHDPQRFGEARVYEYEMARPLNSILDSVEYIKNPDPKNPQSLAESIRTIENSVQEIHAASKHILSNFRSFKGSEMLYSFDVREAVLRICVKLNNYFCLENINADIMPDGNSAAYYVYSDPDVYINIITSLCAALVNYVCKVKCRAAHMTVSVRDGEDGYVKTELKIKGTYFKEDAEWINNFKNAAPAGEVPLRFRNFYNSFYRAHCWLIVNDGFIDLSYDKGFLKISVVMKKDGGSEFAENVKIYNTESYIINAIKRYF